MTETEVKGGFHRTRFSMSMSESAHKKNASDSELPDVDPPKIDDLKKHSANADAAAKAISPPPAKDEAKEESKECDKKGAPKEAKAKGKDKGKGKAGKAKTAKKGGKGANKAKAKTAKKPGTAAGGNKNKKASTKQAKTAKKVKPDPKRTAKKPAKAGAKGKGAKGGKGKAAKGAGGGKHQRKVSVSKKPNLKASNAKKMKAKKSGAKDASADDSESKADDDEKGDATPATGKNRKKVAWYLSGGAKSSEKSSGGKQRTWHEKKKDAKNNAIYKRQAAMEAEVLATYFVFANNMTRRAHGGNPDAAANVEDVDLTGKMESVDFGGMVVDVCAEMLMLLDESWEGRLDVVEELCAQLRASYAKGDSREYYLKLAKFIFPICQSLGDWRSKVILGFEERMGPMVEATPEYFLPFAPYVMRALLPSFAVKIEVLRNAAIGLGEKIVSACHKHDRDHLLLDVVLEGLQHKQDFARCTMAEYLEYMIRSYPCLEKEDGIITDEGLLNTIDQCVRLAVKDRALETRTNGYRALHIYEKISPTKAKVITTKFSKAVARKYNDVISRKNSI